MNFEKFLKFYFQEFIKKFCRRDKSFLNLFFFLLIKFFIFHFLKLLTLEFNFDRKSNVPGRKHFRLLVEHWSELKSFLVYPKCLSLESIINPEIKQRALRSALNCSRLRLCSLAVLNRLSRNSENEIYSRVNFFRRFMWVAKFFGFLLSPTRILRESERI